MIVPTRKDINAIKKIEPVHHDRECQISDYQDCVDSICESRGEVGPHIICPRRFTVWHDQNKAGFVPLRWVIRLTDWRNKLSFLHEVGHLVSLMDRGIFGTEEEAETFAFGAYLYISPNSIPNSRSRWSDIFREPHRTIFWIREHAQLLGAMS